MAIKYAYLEITFDNEAKESYKKLVKELVPNDMLYYSDVMSHIHADVTDKLHLTIFFGLKENAVNNQALQKYIKSLEINEIKVGELFLMDGYRGLYKVICVHIEDYDKKLESIAKEMLNFDYAPEAIYDDFNPHITLAYVQPDFAIPEDFQFNTTHLSPMEIKLSLTE